MNSDRIYQSEDESWYFSVRGNQAKGPFPTYHDAEDALNEHVRRCRAPLGAVSWARALRAIAPGRSRISEPRHP